MTKKELRKALFGGKKLSWEQVNRAAGRDLGQAIRLPDEIIVFHTPRDAALWWCGLDGWKAETLGARAVLTGDHRGLKTYHGLPVKKTHYNPPCFDRDLIAELREDGLAHVHYGQDDTVIWYGEFPA